MTLHRVEVRRGSGMSLVETGRTGSSLFGETVSLATSGSLCQIRCARSDKTFGAFTTDGTTVRTAVLVTFPAIGATARPLMVEVRSRMDNVATTSATVDAERGRVNGRWRRHCVG